MELLQAIHGRRSIRKYQDKQVPIEMVDTILAAAMMAPSAGDSRPWQFIIVTDQDKKDQVKEAHPYAGMVQEAPLAILVCADLDKEKYPGFYPQDCAAAMQNLLLAAHDQGLGAVWTGVYPLEDRVARFREIFALPERIMPFGMAVLGWPAQKPTSKDRFDRQCLHYNHWQGTAPQDR